MKSTIFLCDVHSTNSIVNFSYRHITDVVFRFLDGEVRLRGSSEANAGRVEIKIGGVWGTVSDGWGWDIRSGHVVCRQLGYVKAVRVFTYSRSKAITTEFGF